MDQNDKARIEYLINLNKITSGEVKEMTQLINKYVDVNTKVCGHCSAQIRFAQKRLKIWYEKNEVITSSVESKEKCNTCKKKGRPPGSKNKTKK